MRRHHQQLDEGVAPISRCRRFLIREFQLRLPVCHYCCTVDRRRPELQAHRRAARAGAGAAQRQRRAAGRDGVEEHAPRAGRCRSRRSRRRRATIVMSTRPGAICWVNVAFAPPDRMKLPSCTLRTRSSAGSKVSVSVMVDSRETFVIEIGTVYGPPPTRNVARGGDRTTCAVPNPGDVTGSARRWRRRRQRRGGAERRGAAPERRRAGGSGGGTVAGGGCGGGARRSLAPATCPADRDAGGKIGRPDGGAPGGAATGACRSPARRGGRGDQPPADRRAAAMSGGGPPSPRFCCDPM